MASLQCKAGSWHLQFVYRGDRRTWVIGRVEEVEARAIKAKAEYLLMRIKQRLIHVPNGADIVVFLASDGKPPPEELTRRRPDVTLAEVADRYIEAHREAMEPGSIRVIRGYMANLASTCGPTSAAEALSLSDVQRHVTRRASSAGRVTIQKEIASIRTVYHWAERMGIIGGGFPRGKVVYPKGEECQPWVSLGEAERRVSLGVPAYSMAKAVYLTVAEVADFLAHVLAHNRPKWLYTACLFAAHTGCRRGEVARVESTDVDLTASIVTIRERKRVPGMHSVRMVPMSPGLAAAIRSRLARRYCFGPGERALSPQTLGKYMYRVLEGTRWEPFLGWHTLRHSFISGMASQGVDQRIIDSLVGHQTEAQRRRYRHLYPSTQRDAIERVWGGGPPGGTESTPHA